IKLDLGKSGRQRTAHLRLARVGKKPLPRTAQKKWEIFARDVCRAVHRRVLMRLYTHQLSATVAAKRRTTSRFAGNLAPGLNSESSIMPGGPMKRIAIAA